MKALKRIYTIILTVFLAIAPVSTSYALESVSDVESAKQGVVQVNTIIVADTSEKRIVIGGAGFIIGDAEGTEYVITAKHIVSPSQEMLEAACEYYGLIGADEETTINIRLSTEVVIEGDVVLNASVLTSSEELNMAVLQLPQPIYTRTPLKLLTNRKYDVNNLPYQVDDAVYALGFPEMVSYDSATQYYSDQQVQNAAGQIKALKSVEGVQVVANDAATSDNNYGGPLVNENGYVVGMNLPVRDGEYSCALDSTKIAKILDGLGVSYSQVNSVAKAAETEEEANGADDTATEITPVAPVAKQKSFFSQSTIILICLAALLVIAGTVACIIIFVVKKDSSSKPKKEKKYTGPVFDMDTTSNVKMTGANTTQTNMRLSQPQSAVSDETTILSAMPSSTDGETSLLSEDLQAPQNLGSLLRRRTSEKIDITKSNFVLGKDALHSDYCIEKNSSISRKHAIITSGRNGVYIQDCSSTNGTFINGTKIESERAVLLNSGDIIKLSNEEFEYQI